MKVLMLLLVGACAQSTPEGAIAEGVDTENASFKNLSEETQDVLIDLNEELQEAKELSGESGDILIQHEIEKRKEEVESLNEEIQEVYWEYLEALENCKAKFSCFECVPSEHCVWCPVEKECVLGNQKGPYEGECTIFNSETCSSEGCDQYNSCDLCIMDPLCGWCQEGNYCLEGTASISNSCSQEFYYHLEGNSECPKNKPQGQSAPIATESKEASQLEAEYTELEEEREELLFEIEVLEIARESILEQSAVNQEVTNQIYSDNYQKIELVVDAQASEENREEAEFQIETWNAYTEETSAEISEEVVDESGTVVSNLEESSSFVSFLSN